MIVARTKIQGSDRVMSEHNRNVGKYPNHKLYIGVWYRPPDNLDALDFLYSVLETLDISIFSRFLLVGDFNVDFSNKQHPLFYKFLTILDSFLLVQVVPGPTHTSSSGNQTLIDLALLSNPALLVSCSITAPLSNSDHGISISLLWNNRASPSIKTRTIWRYEYADFERANVLIYTADWSLLYTESDIDKAWEIWLRTYLSIINECIPRKTITQKCTLPWMNKFIQTKIEKRNSAYKRAKQTRVFDGYKKLRNEVVNLLRISKRDYLRKSFLGGSKKFWKAVEEVLESCKAYQEFIQPCHSSFKSEIYCCII